MAQVVYDNFTPGMNLEISPVNIGKGEGTAYSLHLENFILDEKGAIKSRRGFKKAIDPILYDSSGKVRLPVRYLHSHQVADGTYKLLAQGDDKWSEVDLTNKKFTALKTGLTEDVEWAFDKFKTKSYFANGTDAIQTFDGSSTWANLSAIGNIPGSAKYPVSHRNHLFFASGAVVYFSPIDWNGAAAWTATDYIELEPYAGSITGMISNGDYVLVTTRTATFIIHGSSRVDWSPDRIDSVYGCASHNTMRLVNYMGMDLFMWVADAGIVMSDGTRVWLVQSLTTLFQNFNKDRIEYSVATYYTGNDVLRNWYTVGFALKDDEQTFEYNNYVLCFNLNNMRANDEGKLEGGATIFTGIQPDSMAIAKDTDGKEIFYFGDKNGNVFEFDTAGSGYTDNGQAIDYLWVFKHSWSKRYNYSTTALWIKYRVLSPATLTVGVSNSFDATTENEEDVSLTAYVPGKFSEPWKFYQGTVYDNYGYTGRKEISMYEFSDEVFVRFSNSEPGTHIAIHELMFVGNRRGVR